MNKFKEGDRIVCFGGPGVVTKISNSYSTLPIMVKCDDSKTYTFTGDGRYTKYDKLPTLFHVNDIPDKWKELLQRKISERK